MVSHLKYGDGLACPEFVCSVDFDRDDEFFATAGVSRRVKVLIYSCRCRCSLLWSHSLKWVPWGPLVTFASGSVIS